MYSNLDRYNYRKERDELSPGHVESRGRTMYSHLDRYNYRKERDELTP